MISRSLPDDRHTALLYVALGDSTVYGLGASSPSTHYVARLFARLRWEYPAARLTNLGTCQATASDVLGYQVPDAIVRRPHLITLSVGPNDLRQGLSPDHFARRVQVILERVDRETEAALVLNALPDLSLCPRFREPERSALEALTRRYNSALRQVADGFGVGVVDIGLSRRPEPERRRFFCPDGYHPSDAGYSAWAEAVWPAVMSRIPDEVRLAAL